MWQGGEEGNAAHRAGGMAVRLLAGLGELGVPPSALLRAQPRNLRLARSRRAGNVAPRRVQRLRILSRLRRALRLRVRHRPAPHVIRHLLGVAVTVKDCQESS